jgi:uncharacterized membrane protein (DUF485 family)
MIVVILGFKERRRYFSTISQLAFMRNYSFYIKFSAFYNGVVGTKNYCNSCAVGNHKYEVYSRT